MKIKTQFLKSTCQVSGVESHTRLIAAILDHKDRKKESKSFFWVTFNPFSSEMITKVGISYRKSGDKSMLQKAQTASFYTRLHH